MSKDIYAHFPPFGEKKPNRTEEREPQKGDKRVGERVIKQREVYIPSGWYTYKEILDYAVIADRSND